VFRAEVEANFAEGTWQRQAYNSYIATLLDEDRIFPCIYATKGYKGNEQRFMFVDNDDLSEQRHAEALAAALDAYLPSARQLGPNTSLVFLAKHNSKPRTMEEYLDGFWRLLNNLAELDRKAWPDAIPKDIDNDKWCLCYGGEPFFTVIQVSNCQTHNCPLFIKCIDSCSPKACLTLCARRHDRFSAEMDL
jgi:uncharacterized protein